MSYLLAKELHVLCVVLTGLGFFTRGVLMLRRSPLLEHPLLRTLPHLVDTLLLGGGVYLAWLLHQYPFVHGWLTAKFFALVTYILLGTIALRRGRTRRIRLAAWLAALAVYAYLISVAFTHDPWPF